MDNIAIARIATHDLMPDTLAILQKHESNDEIVFFLGRLAWQGGMSECASVFSRIACDENRGLYARIASVRAVLSTGNVESKGDLWDTFIRLPGTLDRRLLAEFLDWATPTTGSVERLLKSLEKVAPFNRYNATGLERTLHTFIDRLPLMADDAIDHPLCHLVEGLNRFLDREPYIERIECRISKEFASLMSPALHAVDRLVAARAAGALSSHSTSIMRKMPSLHFWQGEDFSEYKLSLGQNVPRWKELNDLLYWTSIAESRSRLAKEGLSLVDDRPILFYDHLWNFGVEDFERCLVWVRTKEDDADRMVALSRCVTLYVQANRPVAWLALMHAAVEGDEKLQALLSSSVDPSPSPVAEIVNARFNEMAKQRKAWEKEEELKRADWVRDLKSNPDRVLHPEGLKPGEFSRDHYHLLMEILGDRLAVSRECETNWRGLIPEFGEAVARAFRDAAVAHWRAYQPSLQSEGADPASIPYSLIFGMAGLAIEYAEDSAFAGKLTDEQARNAFRYITWELNGFPRWFEPLYRVHSVIGLELVTKELTWELNQPTSGQPLHYILHDILYYAPWLHGQIAPLILNWLASNNMSHVAGLNYCLRILMEGGTPAIALANLAVQKIGGTSPADQRPRWFALWVDTDPVAAIPALEAILRTLPSDDAMVFAQQFVVALTDDKHGTGTRTGAYRSAQHLKDLYVLMHRYIRVADDIERANRGVYSPTLRDNAQQARDMLFNLLAEVPGPESYAAIKSLESDHPEPSHRPWMARRARNRAILDADEPLWTVGQVATFVHDIMNV